MKIFTSAIACILMTFTLSFAQSLPFNFDSDITTADFVDFDGGVATVIDNPQMDAENSSSKVAQIVRNGGATWGGSKVILSANLDFSSSSSISMKVFTSAPAGTNVKFKLEGDGSAERDVTTTVSNAWETLTWDFTGTPANYNEVVFMFDFGNIGDGSANSTFLFDDVEQIFPGTQIDWPVDFEQSNVNYTMSDFGGNLSSVVADPTNASNTVVKVIKPLGAATWAGTTIGTPAGFATDLPLTLTDSKMTVRVWSPTADTPIRLKVEDSDDPTHTCETEVRTTLSGEWETLVFDFNDQAPGTELLSIGLQMGWTYNMASIFFNFDTDGDTAGEQTYYFDDVYFGEVSVGINDIEIGDFEIYPNPSKNHWNISNPNEQLQTLEIFKSDGSLIQTFQPLSHQIKIDNSDFNPGIYFARIKTKSGTASIQLIKS